MFHVCLKIIAVSRRSSDARENMERMSDIEPTRDVRRSKSFGAQNFEEGLLRQETQAISCVSPSESSHGAVNSPDHRDLSTPVWVPRLVNTFLVIRSPNSIYLEPEIVFV